MSGKDDLDPSSGHGAVFNQQPAGSDVTHRNANSSAVVESYPGGVTVRTLRDEQEDAEFAARLLVDAFRGKFVHAVGENK